MRNGRSRLWLTSALVAGLGPASALAQVPVPPSGPASTCQARPGGPLRRAVRHIGFTLHDRLIGYPDQFIEPPLGFYLNETTGVMRSKADVHDFYLYRSDFVDGTSTLSPIGAQRLSLMTARLSCWLGPVVVEWTPDRPGLAEQRRDAVVALFLQANQPIVPERVVVGPSPYPGLPGDDAENNFRNLIARDRDAARGYSLSPSSTATFGGGGR